MATAQQAELKERAGGGGAGSECCGERWLVLKTPSNLENKRPEQCSTVLPGLELAQLGTFVDVREAGGARGGLCAVLTASCDQTDKE